MTPPQKTNVKTKQFFESKTNVKTKQVFESRVGNGGMTETKTNSNRLE